MQEKWCKSFVSILFEMSCHSLLNQRKIRFRYFSLSSKRWWDFCLCMRVSTMCSTTNVSLSLNDLFRSNKSNWLCLNENWWVLYIPGIPLDIIKHSVTVNTTHHIDMTWMEVIKRMSDRSIISAIWLAVLTSIKGY